MLDNCICRLDCQNICLTVLRKDKEALALYKKWYNNQEILSSLGIGDDIFEETDLERILDYTWDSRQKRFNIYHKAEKRIIGVCSVTVDDKYINGEIDIVIDEDYRNRKYGEEAINKIVQFSFEELRIHRLEVNVISDNSAAIKCYKKCGFEECGIMHEKIFTKSKYHDVMVMEIIRK